MRFGVDMRANTPYPTHHGGLKANGECLKRRIPCHSRNGAM